MKSLPLQAKVRSDSGENTNIYEPLPTGSYFRHLEISPGQGDEPLVCKLLISRIKTSPRYAAISYTWGDRCNASEAIVCSGKSTRITSSLKHILRRHRHKRRRRILWVDQLCINQQDAPEKSHQVSLMGRIYAKARRVFIWLGPDTNAGVQSASLVAAINYFNGMSPDDRPRTQSRERKAPRSEDELLNDPRWRALHQVFSSRWFTRVWIIQEVGLARNPRVRVGGVPFSWNALMGVYVWMTISKYSFSDFGLTDPHVSRIHVDTISGWGSLEHGAGSDSDSESNLLKGPDDFLDLLYETQALDASDSRDLLYSLLSHPAASFDGAPIVQSNYSVTDLDAYHDFAVRWLERTSSLSLLAAVRHSSESLMETYPSWVPRWDLKIPSSPSFQEMVRDSWTEPGQPFDIVDGRYLKIRGIIVDSIRCCSYVLNDFNLDISSFSIAQDGQETANNTNPIIQSWCNMADLYRRTELATQNPPSQSFAHALTARRRSIEGDPQYSRNVKAFIHLLIKLTGKQPAGEKMDSLHKHAHDGSVTDFLRDTRLLSSNRKVMLTSSGYIGTTPPCTEADDVCGIVLGCPAPFVLRRAGIDDRYKIVGTAYVEGLMQEKDVDAFKNGEIEEQELVLV